MSIPAFGWALACGVEHKLRPSDRLLLLFLADQADRCTGMCRSAGQSRIEQFTGMDRKTIQAATARLAAIPLIRVTASPGLAIKYEVLCLSAPGNGTVVEMPHPGNMQHGAPGNGTVVTPGNGTDPPRETTPEPRETAPPSLLIPRKTLRKTRAPAREGEGSQTHQHPSAAPQPTPDPPKAPTIGTTPGGSGNYRPPSAHAAYADPAEARATFQAYLDRKRAEAHPEPTHDETSEPAAHRSAAKRAAAATIYQLRKYAPAPGAKPERSRTEQIDAITQPATNVAGEILPPIRRGPLDPVRTVAEQLAALGYPNMAEASV